LFYTFDALTAFSMLTGLSTSQNIDMKIESTKIDFCYEACEIN